MGGGDGRANGSDNQQKAVRQILPAMVAEVAKRIIRALLVVVAAAAAAPLVAADWAEAP